MTQKKHNSRKNITTSNKRVVTCTKSHGHLVCWITSKKAPAKKRILFNFIIPGTHNNHKPHLIRRSSLLFITVLILGLQLGYNYLVAQQKQILGYATNVSAKAVINEVNSARQASGQTQLSGSSELDQAASLKANDMLTKNYWSHNAPDGTQPWRWFELAGYPYQSAGENLAKDFMTSGGVVKAWLDSPSHRENMLSGKFEDIGIAAVNGSLNGKQTTLVVALFGTKKTALNATTEAGTVNTTTNYHSTIFANPAQVATLASPISIITLLLLIAVAIVALLTHWHYIKLPRKVRKSWYRHHAIYTAGVALIAVAYVAYIFTSGTI